MPKSGGLVRLITLSRRVPLQREGAQAQPPIMSGDQMAPRQGVAHDPGGIERMASFRDVLQDEDIGPIIDARDARAKTEPPWTVALVTAVRKLRRGCMFRAHAAVLSAAVSSCKPGLSDWWPLAGVDCSRPR